MPIYEFRCTACGMLFEELILRRREEEELVCPRCKAPRVKRQLSTFTSAGAPASPGVAAGGCGPGTST